MAVPGSFRICLLTQLNANKNWSFREFRRYAKDVLQNSVKYSKIVEIMKYSFFLKKRVKLLRENIFRDIICRM